MFLIRAEIKKWKRSKILIGIVLLTVIIDAFAIERAFSISRESPLMNSFGDLYCLAFKNLTVIFLPITIGIISTMLFFDERKNDTLKSLLIIPVSKLKLLGTKFIVIELLTTMLIAVTYLSCVIGAVVSEGFVDFNINTLKEAAILYISGAIFIPIAMLPVICICTFAKNYILPIVTTLLYLAFGILGGSVLAGIHPLSSLLGIYQNISPAAKEMVESSIGGEMLYISGFRCVTAILIIGLVFICISIISMRKQNY